jgi:hypothetical protein
MSSGLFLCIMHVVEVHNYYYNMVFRQVDRCFVLEKNRSNILDTDLYCFRYIVPYVQWRKLFYVPCAHAKSR